MLGRGVTGSACGGGILRAPGSAKVTAYKRACCVSEVAVFREGATGLADSLRDAH